MIGLNEQQAVNHRDPKDDRSFQAELTLRRLRPRLNAVWERHGLPEDLRHQFDVRLSEHWEPLFRLLIDLYSDRYDFFYHSEQILLTCAEAYASRPPELKKLDIERVHNPSWFQSQRIVGGALYVNLFSENLCRLREHVGYFQELGITYLHLMPLFAVRPGNNDGGYAISNYRSIDPSLGTVDDLRGLASDLQTAGINLVLDFVFNHTADDHEWAMKAAAGDREYQEYYYTFDDRRLPDLYERHLREIFPTVRRGNFTWHDGMQRWVWTTFNSFQWDLNYSNPAVFNAMLGEMLFIANLGVDVLRLDAVAFIWKQLGTSCENLPQAHSVIQAFNRLVRIVAPGLVFKSEAIVHPDEVIRYVSEDECQVSYNPTLMALLWESLATRRTNLLVRSLNGRFQVPEGTAWVNYLRCHDDIGWTFDDVDAQSIGINPYDHRQFLNRFYTGQFEGSFARGVPFQENTVTGDMRISGTMASLAGLERAIELYDDHEKELAIRRMLLLHGVTLSIGGIPLLYVGEEWGMLNDYDFIQDPAKAGDSRWIHRPRMKWEFLDELDDELDHGSIRRRIFRSLQSMIAIRKRSPALGGQQMKLIDTRNDRLLAYLRTNEGSNLIVVANFSEHEQEIDGNCLRTAGYGRFFENVLDGSQKCTSERLTLSPYDIFWLRRI